MTYTILSVSRDGAEALAGDVRLRRCAKCGAEWAQVNLLPYPPIPPAEWPNSFDVLLVKPGASRTGLHHCTVGNGYYPLYPTRPFHPDLGYWSSGARDREHVVAGPVAIRPAIYANGYIARWRNDYPWAHDAAAICTPSAKSIEFPCASTIAECGHCFRDRLAQSDLCQGHLYLARVAEDAEPRIFSTSQPGVVEVKEISTTGPIPYTTCKVVFNHQFGPDCRVLLRGNIGSVTVPNREPVYSSDHPFVDLEPGVYEFFHPWPARDGGVD